MHTGTEIPSDCGRVGSWKRAQTEVWCQPVQPGGDHGRLHFCKSAVSTTFLWTIPIFFHIFHNNPIKIKQCKFIYGFQSKSGHRQILNLQNIHQMFNSQIFIIARLVAVNGWFLYEYFVKKQTRFFPHILLMESCRWRLWTINCLFTQSMKNPEGVKGYLCTSV